MNFQPKHDTRFQCFKRTVVFVALLKTMYRHIDRHRNKYLFGLAILAEAVRSILLVPNVVITYYQVPFVKLRYLTEALCATAAFVLSAIMACGCCCCRREDGDCCCSTSTGGGDGNVAGGGGGLVWTMLFLPILALLSSTTNTVDPIVPEGVRIYLVSSPVIFAAILTHVCYCCRREWRGGTTTAAAGATSSAWYRRPLWWLLIFVISVGGCLVSWQTTFLSEWDTFHRDDAINLWSMFFSTYLWVLYENFAKVGYDYESGGDSRGTAAAAANAWERTNRPPPSLFRNRQFWIRNVAFFSSYAVVYYGLYVYYCRHHGNSGHVLYSRYAKASVLIPSLVVNYLILKVLIIQRIDVVAYYIATLLANAASGFSSRLLFPDGTNFHNPYFNPSLHSVGTVVLVASAACYFYRHPILEERQLQRRQWEAYYNGINDDNAEEEEDADGGDGMLMSERTGSRSCESSTTGQFSLQG